MEINQIIKELGKTNDEVYAKVCQVTSVNTNKKTVDVQPIDNSAPIVNVRLQADVQYNGFVLLPKIGSNVLVVFVNKKTAIVVNTSEITKYELKISNCELSINPEGFLLKKENETLKKLMSDLILAIKAMSFTLTTPDTINGTTTMLNNSAQFTSIENRFNQFLK